MARRSARLAANPAPSPPAAPAATSTSTKRAAPKRSKKPTAGKAGKKSVSTAAGSAKPTGVSKRPSLRINPKGAVLSRARKAAAAATALESTPAVPANERGGPPNNDARTALGSSSHELNFMYGAAKDARTPRRLRGDLRVYSLPEDEHSLLEYTAVFHLVPTTAGQDYEEVGCIQAYRLDKNTARAPNAKASFITRFVIPCLGTFSEETTEWELALVLRAVFKQDGGAKKARKVLEEELTQRSVIFIKLIHTLDTYQKSGLLRPMLQCFREMLQTLPEWFAFQDVLILNPGRAGGEERNSWGEMKDAEVEKALTQIYQRVDGYQLVVNGKVGGYQVPVLGRMVADEPVDAPADDAGTIAGPDPAAGANDDDAASATAGATDES